MMSFSELQSKIQNGVNDFLGQALQGISFNLPEVLSGLGILILGWLMAIGLYVLCVSILRFFAIDKLSAKTPLNSLLRTVNIHRNPVEILALLIGTFIALRSLEWSVDIMHFSRLSTFFDVFATYIPSIILAWVILIIGALGARFIDAITVPLIQRMGMGHEHTIGNIIHWIIFTIVCLFAIGKLGIDLTFLATNISIMGIVLIVLTGAGGIVGARPLLENFLLCIHLRRTVHIGDTIKIEHIQGKVANFTATSVVIFNEEGDKKTVLPASYFYRYHYVCSS